MEIARTTADIMVLRTARRDREIGLLAIVIGLGLVAVGCADFVMQVCREWSLHVTAKPWSALVAPGLAACMLGLYVLGQTTELVFHSASATCESTWSWFGRATQRMMLSPATIIYSEHSSRQGRRYYRAVVYCASEIEHGLFAAWKARLKGRSVCIGEYHDRAILDGIVEEISAFTEKRVAVRWVPLFPAPRQKIKSTRRRHLRISMLAGGKSKRVGAVRRGRRK